MIWPLVGAAAALLAFALVKKPAAQTAQQATTIQGRSGAVWGVNPIPSSASNMQAFEVYFVQLGLNAAPPPGTGGVSNTGPGSLILRYAQQGNDATKRTFLDSPLPPNDPVLAIAKSDFGLPA